MANPQFATLRIVLIEGVRSIYPDLPSEAQPQKCSQTCASDGKSAVCYTRYSLIEGFTNKDEICHRKHRRRRVARRQPAGGWLGWRDDSLDISLLRNRVRRVPPGPGNASYSFNTGFLRFLSGAGPR